MLQRALAMSMDTGEAGGTGGGNTGIDQSEHEHSSYNQSEH